MAKQSYNSSPGQSINIISAGTKIKGDIIANGDTRIDGELIGNIAAKGKLVIGPKGRVEGEVNCNNIEVSGNIKGKVTASELLNMKSTSNISGDIIAGKLSVEPGSMFTGTCAMGGSKPTNEQTKTR